MDHCSQHNYSDESSFKRFFRKVIAFASFPKVCIYCFEWSISCCSTRKRITEFAVVCTNLAEWSSSNTSYSGQYTTCLTKREQELTIIMRKVAQKR